MSTLKDLYKNEAAPALMKKFNYKSTMQIPKLDKIVVNIACGDAKDNSKVIEYCVRTSLPSPVRRLPFVKHANRSQTSNCVKVCLSALK